MKQISVTRTIKMTQWQGGGCGRDGVACYQILKDGKKPKDPEHAGAYMYGLPLENVLNKNLWDGAILEVTVKLIKQGKRTTNPWWEQAQERRKKAKKKKKGKK
jgi:hypothetical protein